MRSGRGVIVAGVGAFAIVSGLLWWDHARGRALLDRSRDVFQDSLERSAGRVVIGGTLDRDFDFACYVQPYDTPQAALRYYHRSGEYTGADPAFLRFVPMSIYVPEDERAIAFVNSSSWTVYVTYLEDEDIYGTLGSRKCFDLRSGPIEIIRAASNGLSRPLLWQRLKESQR